MKRFLWAVFGVLLTGNAFAFDAYRSACSGDFCTAEFEKMNGLTQIGADLAYETLAQYGKTAGQGVTVAVVDSGILLTHPEFSGKISDLQNLTYDGVALNPVWGDHGTHVAGIIGAAKDGAEMHGVAYGAALLGFSAIGCGDTACLDTDGSWRALASSTFNDVKISNNSWGWGAWSLYAGSDAVSDEIVQLTLSDAQKLAAENKLIVAAASNDTMLSPNVAVAGLPYYDSSVKNNIVSVVAYDPSKQPTDKDFLASFSNLAYKAEDWSIAAPGVNIYSAVADSNEDYGFYKYMDGTSMAAPTVSGAAAVVSSAFPFLNGKQLADVLLSNAYKLDSSNAAPYYRQYNFLPVTDATGTSIDSYIPIVRYVIMSGSGPDETERRNLVNLLKAMCAGTGYACADVQVYYNNQSVSSDGGATYDAFDGNYLTYEEVFGQGLLDLDSSVKGLKTLDANRLNESSDYNSAENGWFYTVNVNAGEEGLPFQHDITETKHKTLHTDAAVGLRKTGDGELRFSGVAGWTGATIIDGGTLRLDENAKIYRGGRIDINENGTLAGTGTADGISVINKGVLESTVRIETAHFENDGGTIYFNRAGDTLMLGSHVFDAGAVGFNTDNLESGTYTLLDAGSGALNGLENMTLPTYDDIIFYDFAYDASDAGKLNVTIKRYRLDDDMPYETPLSADEKAVAAAWEQQISNGENAFKAYYSESEESIKSKIRRTRAQVQSVAAENLPLANKISDNVNARLFNLSRGYAASGAIGRRRGLRRAYRGRAGGTAALSNAVWVQGIGGKAYVDANQKTGAAKIESRLFGAMAGADFAVNRNFILGFTAGYAKSKMRQDGDKTDVQDWRAGVYFSAKRGMFSLNGIALGGYQKYEGLRKGGVAFDTDLNKKFNGRSAEGGLNLGIDLYSNGNPYAARSVHMRPYVAANYVYKYQKSYTETGDDAFALHVGDATDTSVTGQTGLTVGFAAPRFKLTLDAAYQHLMKGDVPQVSAYFASDAARTAFTSVGDQGDKDFFVLGGGFDIRFTDAFSMNIWADNRFSDNTRSHTGMVTLKWHF